MAEELPIPNEPSMASKPPKGSPFNDGGVLAGGHSRRLALISVVGYFLLYPIFICSILLEESPTFAIIICIIMCIYVYIYYIYIYLYISYNIILLSYKQTYHQDHHIAVPASAFLASQVIEGATGMGKIELAEHVVGGPGKVHDTGF